MTELKPSQIERIKLSATFLNAIASGTVLAALVGPFVGIGLGTVQPSADIVSIVGLSLIGFVLAVVIHFIARRMLLALDG